MQYIQLSDDSFILHTNRGAVTVNRTSFNFNRIKTMLDKGTLEEYNLLPLLEPPELPDGVFQLYVGNLVKLFYKQTKVVDNKVLYTFKALGEDVSYRNASEELIESSTLLGVYANVKDIMFDYPEYFI